MFRSFAPPAQRLVTDLHNAVAQVGIDEFQSQEGEFEEDSRLGRELLYLASNDEWIRASREIVTLDAADSIGTRLNIHVDLAKITHEAFRHRLGRLWLPLAIIPPPVRAGRRATHHGHGPVSRWPGRLFGRWLIRLLGPVLGPVLGRVLGRGPGWLRRIRRHRPRMVPTPTIRDAGGTVIPALQQSEARRWMAAALAEIILNMAPTALADGSPLPWTGRDSPSREQRLLLSAALFRLLRSSDARSESRRRFLTLGRSRAEPESPDRRRRPGRPPDSDDLDTVDDAVDLDAADDLDDLDEAELDVDEAELDVDESELDEFGPVTIEDGRRRTRIENARTALLGLLDEVSARLEAHAEALRTSGPDRDGPYQPDRSDLLLDRAIRVVHALRNPTTLVVLGVELPRTAGVFTVEIVGRPLLASGTMLPHAPRARLDLDVLLPATDADHAVIVHLPDGLSFGGHGTASPVEVEVATRRPPALTHIDDLAWQLARPGLAAPVARCLVDLALARIEAARDTFRHYAATRRQNQRTELQPLGPDGVPGYLSAFREALQTLRTDAGDGDFGPLTEAAATAYRAARHADITDFAVYARTHQAGIVSPHRAHVRLPAVENRSVRATPIRAQVRLYVRADASGPLFAARRAGFLSLILLAALLTFQATWGFDGDNVDVLASVLTLFAAIQATRIQNPDRSTLRGLVVASGAWVIVASILPTVLLGMALAFSSNQQGAEPQDAVELALVAQIAIQALMFLPVLTGRAWLPSTPRLKLGTGALLDYERTDVLREAWWRTTTAGSLLLGDNAHAYVVPQQGGQGIGELLATVNQRSTAPTTEQVPVPANILAMLRAGTASSTLTFVVLREEPEERWQPDRAPVYLDVDRLIVTETPIGNIDVHLGFPGRTFLPLTDHPLDTLLGVVGAHKLLLPDVQFPSPPPRSGDPDRLWARVRIGLRADEISRVSVLLCTIAERLAARDDLDLLVDMTTQTPPRRFRGTAVQDGEFSVRPRDLDVTWRPADRHPGPARVDAGVDVGAAVDVGAGEDEPAWLSAAAYDYVRPGIERELLAAIARRHPDLLLAGLTTARLHGVSMVFVLGRRRGTALTSGAVALGGAASDPRVMHEYSCTTAELGSFPAAGLLLRVHARYSDKPRLFAELLDDLAHSFSDIADRSYVAVTLQLAYVFTEVADGRNVVTKFMVVLPDADPRRFDVAALDRAERSARRVITRSHAQGGGPEQGGTPDARALVSIYRLTEPVYGEEAAGPPAPSGVIDLRVSAPSSTASSTATSTSAPPAGDPGSGSRSGS